MDILIVVDMQNDFVSGALGTQEAVNIVPCVVGRVVDGINRGRRSCLPGIPTGLIT